MEKSFDGLIEYVLGEIAVSGPEGVLPQQISEFVASYYAEEDHNNSKSTEKEQDQVSADQAQLVDDDFLQTVWKWLGRHPDVSIGPDKRYNHLSLGESNNASRGANDDPDKDPVNRVRLSVNYERTYQAICGHAPDQTKVFPSEYILLTHIAVQRSAGILQGDLVRASGQDKRSVPKRTDALHAKGYIVKQEVFVKGSRTSRLILRRYIQEDTNDNKGVNTSVNQHRGEKVRDALDTIVRILSNETLLPIYDVATKSGLTHPLLAKVGSKIIRQLEHVGCLKRIKAAFGPQANNADLKNCAQFLRKPTQEDLESIDKSILDLNQLLKEIAPDAFITPPTTSDIPDEPENVRYPEQRLQEITQGLPPQWNPDRLMTNVLCDAARMAGTTGMTNFLARTMITGNLFRRPLESLLVRVSHRSLLTQPIHLQHLAIIRSSANSDGSGEFVYHSIPGFQQFLQDNRVEATKVPGIQKLLNSSKATISSQNISTKENKVIEYDSLGFPITSPPKVQYRNGNATFDQLVKSAAARSVQPRHGEPQIHDKELGKVPLQDQPSRHRKSTPRLPAPDSGYRSSVSQSHDGDNEPERVIKGRPRKFLRGTEKFWQLQFLQARLESLGDGEQLSSKSGVMNDPAGLAIFRSRPEKFDETLVEAIRAGLPIPSSSEDITESWIHDTKRVLDRSETGISVSPPGVHLGRTRYLSQIMIVKSTRLDTLDFSDRQRVPKFRFISSMLSHSFELTTPDLGLLARPSQDTQLPSISRRKVRKSRQPRQHQKEKPKSGPKLGLFFEPSSGPKPDETSQSEPVPSLDPSEYHMYMDTTESESEQEPEYMSVPVQEQSTSSHHERSGVDNASTDIESNMIENTRHYNKGADPSRIVTNIRPTRARKLTRKAAELLEQESGDHVSPASLGQPVTHAHIGDRSHSLQTTTDDLAISPPLETSQHILSTESMPDDESRHTIPAARIEDGLYSVNADGKVTDADRHDKNADRHSVTRKSSEAEEHETILLESPAISKHLTPPQTAILIDDEKSSRDAEIAFSQPKEDVATLDNAQPTPSRKRRREVIEDSEDEFEAQQANKRLNQGRGRRERNNVCRRLVLDLIELSGGAGPNNASTIRRTMANSWQAAGQEEDRPPLKPLKLVIKGLCETGKLKTIIFSFRGRSGIMEKRSILAFPRIHGAGQQIQDLKQRMIEADTTDYVPLEWQNEALQSSRTILKQHFDLEQTSDSPPRDISSPQLADSTLVPVAKIAASNGFLSLQCHRLAELPQVVEFNELQKERDSRVQATNGLQTRSPNVQALGYNNIQSRSRRQTAGRRAKGTRFDPDTHKIIWKPKVQNSSLPTSLQEMLDSEYDRNPAVRPMDNLPAEEKFALEIDHIANWELRNASKFEERLDTVRFINHTVHHDISTTADIRFKSLVRYDQHGIQEEDEYPPVESWLPFVIAMRTAADEMEDDPETESLLELRLNDPDALTARRNLTKRRTRRRISSIGDTDFRQYSGAVKRRRRRTMDSHDSTPDLTESRNDLGTNTLRKRSRQQIIRLISEEQIYQLAITIICVRALAGGVESMINWQIVTKLFPDQEEELLKKKWKTIHNSYRKDVNTLTEDLQYKYIDAVENEKVPMIELENPSVSDWEGIVAWAVENLNISNNKQTEELPDNRAELLAIQDLTFSEPQTLRSVLNYNVITSQPQKEEIISGVVFGLPKTSPSSSTPKTLKQIPVTEAELQSRAFCVARSWVMSLILTPESTFYPEQAHAKLLTLSPTLDECESLVSSALISLQRDKIVTQERNVTRSGVKSSAEPRQLRTWEPSQKFYETFQFRRMITQAMLNTAATYKLRTLDDAFQRGEIVTIEKEAVMEDGEMVSIFNLLAQGMLTIQTGQDVPNSRYGIDHANIGYQTKLADKAKFAFSVELLATPQYIFGDPLADTRKLAIPRGETEEPHGRIPAWIDINGTLQPKLWEMFLAAIIGIISIRPGVNATELSRTVNHGLTEWEIEIMLSWAGRIGVVRKTPVGNGWETCPWWWLCIGTGVDGGWN